MTFVQMKKYLLSLFYYKNIILNKKDFISKESKCLKNIHLTSQIQFENFNGLEINLCKDEIITIEKYFESIDNKGFNDKNDDNNYYIGIVY